MEFLDLCLHRGRLEASPISRVFSSSCAHGQVCAITALWYWLAVCSNGYILTHEPGYVPALHNIALRISLSQSDIKLHSVHKIVTLIQARLRGPTIP